MFSFDDRYIVFVILAPGIFFIGLLIILLNLYDISFEFIKMDSDVFGAVFGLVSAVIIGMMLWLIEKKMNFHATEKRLIPIERKISRGDYFESFKIKEEEFVKKFKKDFKKDFFAYRKDGLKTLQENFADIYYGLDRAIGLKIPSALKLLGEFLINISVAIWLAIFIYSLSIIIFLLKGGGSCLIMVSVVKIVACLSALNIIIYKIISENDKRFYYAILDVYTANHYKEIFK